VWPIADQTPETDIILFVVSIEHTEEVEAATTLQREALDVIVI
jgi:hypothetical protein